MSEEAMAAMEKATSKAAPAAPPAELAPQAAGVEMAAPAGEGAVAAPESEAAAAPAADAPPVLPAPPAAPQPPKELEEDAAEDKRPKLKSPVEFLTKDTTLNIMPSVHGNVLMALTDGGIQHLLAGARANVGITSGRHMFEVKMVEMLNPVDASGYKGRAPQPLNMLRIGFSTSSSTLILGNSEDNFCFDAGGALLYNKSSNKVAEGWVRDNTITVVLNLDASSPNANTASIFRDGVRVCQPQPIPEKLKGKALFPAVTFRNMTIHVNFGPLPCAELPFKCRTWQDAADKDCEVLAEPKPKGGMYDALFPVCLPDEGTFDWLDFFLEKNPSYVELSDRMILDWADKSGIWRTKGYGWRASNDKPDMQFGVPSLDDGSIKRTLYSIASSQQRNFVIMEVKGNLMKEERQALLKKFCAPHLRVTSQVLVGEPTKEFKERSLSLILNDKQERHDLEWKVKQQEEIHKKKAEKLARQQAREQKKAEKAAAEGKAAATDPAPAAGETKDGEQKAAGEAKPAEEAKMDVDPDKKEEEADEDDSELDAKIEELVAATPPKIQLADEERKHFFRKPKTMDLTPMLLSSTFAGFTLPEKEEGFSDVRYEWLKKTKSAEYMKDWMLNLKLTTRVEDLQPGEWFTKQWSAWQQQVTQWHSKKTEIELAQKAEAAKASAEREAKRRKIMEDENNKDEEKKEGEAEEEKKPDGEKVEEPAKAEDKENQDANQERKAAEEDENIEDEDFDVFGVENVLDAGKGKPLCANFTWEDWALMSLRYELFLLVHAFRKDVNDPERPGIHTDHIQFYYSRYFRKALTVKNYGVDTYDELVNLIKDTVSLNKKNSVLEVHISDELDSFDLFLKLTEECRRERGLLLDSGNESYALKFNQQALQPQVGGGSHGSYGRQQYQRGGWGNDQDKGYTKGGWQSGKDQGSKSGGYSYGGSGYKDSNYKGGGGGGKPVGGSYAIGTSAPVGGSPQYQKRPYSSYTGGKGGYGR